MNTRSRVIISSLVSSALFFFVLSPVLKNIYDYILPPSPVLNLKINMPSNQQINLNWETPTDTDLKGFRVEYANGSYDVSKSVNNYTLYGDEVNENNVYKIYSVDEGNNVSSPLQFSVKDIKGEIVLNQSYEIPFVLIMSFLTLLIFVVISIFSLFVIYFKFNKLSFIPVNLFPALVTIPYSLLTISTLQGIENNLNKIIFCLITSVALAFILYISLLTTNILNTAQKVKIPLEQAAKAVQFILNLISTYIILIFAFGSYQNLILRLLVIVPFVIIYTYSSFWVAKADIKANSITIKTIGIALLVALGVVVASFWPIDISYAILLVAVIYYILLNVALEMRVKYTKTLWVEYSVLIVLLLILFFTNASWGINFTIL